MAERPLEPPAQPRKGWGYCQGCKKRTTEFWRRTVNGKDYCGSCIEFGLGLEEIENMLEIMNRGYTQGLVQEPERRRCKSFCGGKLCNNDKFYQVLVDGKLYCTHCDIPVDTSYEERLMRGSGFMNSDTPFKPPARLQPSPPLLPPSPSDLTFEDD